MNIGGFNILAQYYDGGYGDAYSDPFAWVLPVLALCFIVSLIVLCLAAADPLPAPKRKIPVVTYEPRPFVSKVKDLNQRNEEFLHSKPAEDTPRG